MAMSLLLLIIKTILASREQTGKKIHRKDSLNPKIVPAFSHLVELTTGVLTCPNVEINIIFNGVQLFGDVIVYVTYSLLLDFELVPLQ